ncbi:hypothetical protein RRSWK_00886 [Rhodopirellula sp. SWK7]|nr:hypothetical protein RRSWK_00886 [Rhodopirellula sp. SWK7]
MIGIAGGVNQIGGTEIGLAERMSEAANKTEGNQAPDRSWRSGHIAVTHDVDGVAMRIGTVVE